MTKNGVALEIWDNGGRRSMFDRRYYSYSNHIPERRSGTDRRSVKDRRSGEERRLKPRIIDPSNEQIIFDRRKRHGIY